MGKREYLHIYGYEVVERISSSERIIKIKEPKTGRNLYSHQFLEDDKWNLV